MAIELTKPQAIRFLLAWHHLTDAAALHTLAEVPDYVGKIGCIQFDPLDPAGRNPDLVLQSRLPGYRRGELDKLLYEEHRLIDQWDKCMAIIRMEDWPCFSRTRAYIQPRYERVEKGVAHIRQYLGEHQSASTADIELDEKIPWAWGPNRLARAALEWMHYAGEVVVSRKQGARRFYSLPHHTVPGELLTAQDPNGTEEEWRRWQVRRRLNSVGLLWNRGGDAWLGIMDWKSAHRESGFRQLLEAGEIEEARVEGIPHPLYIHGDNLPLLRSVMDEPVPEDHARLIAPLDNLIWDRKLVEALFGFDYRWEVYTPADRRKYGYYVLPVLCGERFVGRIEPVADKKTGALVVRNFWWEPDLRDKRPYRKHVRACIKRFARYARCRDIVYQAKL